MREIFRQYFTKGFGFGAGFIAVLFTAGLLAVAVSTMTTFTTGTPAKASEVNANFAALKTAIEGIPSEKAMRLIYVTDITTAVTSLNITGLNGDSDIEYEIRARFVSGTGSGSLGYFIRPNGDSTISNYITSYVYISNSANPTKVVDNPANGLNICGTLSNASGGICYGNSMLYAKSGFLRTAFGKALYHSSTANWTQYDHSSAYLIPGTNIVSLTIFADAANGIGAGSHIEIWARR
jgi:hypothetical protein